MFSVVFLYDFSILNANLQIMSVFMADQLKIMSVFMVVYRTWRDITLPTKVHLVNAMVFQVVMYGCESWTIKKAITKELMF